MRPEASPEYGSDGRYNPAGESCRNGSSRLAASAGGACPGVANQKGGVCKTTTVVNLAAALAEIGKRILVVDLDGQCNATTWLGVQPGRGILDLFEGAVDNVDEIVVASRIEGVSTVPATPGLANLDRALASEPGGEQILKLGLKRTGAAWDLVLIDCPPALGLATVNALTASHLVLVSCETSSLALDGLNALLETVDKVRLRMNPTLKLLGILPNKVDLRMRVARDVIVTLRERFNEAVLGSSIRHSVRFLEAPAHRKPITEYDRHGRGGEDFRALADEIAARIRP